MPGLGIGLGHKLRGQSPTGLSIARENSYGFTLAVDICKSRNTDAYIKHVYVYIRDDYIKPW